MVGVEVQPVRRRNEAARVQVVMRKVVMGGSLSVRGWI